MADISIVLPAYKGRFLREAIASILSQTHRDFELVVVDDCSPESLKAVVDGFHDERLSYHRNEANIGGRDLVAAWQRALSFAHGEWVVLAGDDDVYEPRFLEEMVRLAEKYPQVDLVHCRQRIIDGEGRVQEIAPAKRELESAIELAYMRLVRGARQYVPDFMFRRSRLEEIGGFVTFPKAWYSDDATWMLMAANGCANCNEPLYSFRMSGLNISSECGKVSELVRAGLLYRDWARREFERLKPASEDEEAMLAALRAALDDRVYGLIVQEMRTTTWSERLHVLQTVEMPRHLKLGILKDALLGRLPWFFPVSGLVGIFTVIFILDRVSKAEDLSRVNLNWWICMVIDSTGFACALVALVFLLPKCLAKRFFAVLAVWSLLIVGISLFTKVCFGISFQGETALILLGSSWQEIRDFIALYFHFWWIVGMLAFVAVLALTGWGASKCGCVNRRGRSVLPFVLMLGPWLIWHLPFLPEVFEIGTYGAWDRIRPLTFAKFTPFSIFECAYEGLGLHRNMIKAAQKPDLPQSIAYRGSTNAILGVVLIGESATRNRWSLYGYGRSTTPGVEKWASELFVFRDLVSAAPGTTKALRYIFSAANSETEQSARYFLPTVCQRGGYEGVFLSAQGHWGRFDGVDNIIFRACQKKTWLMDGRNTAVFDGELLPLIQEEVNGGFSRKALFVHLEGSHHDPQDRYPPDWAYFGKDETGMINPTKSDHYDNSIRYTDDLISKVLAMVKERDCPAFVIYLSDHGDSPDSSFWRYAPDPNVWEVPMFVWVSEKYRKLYPSLVEALRKSVDKPLVSDQLLQGFVRLFLLEGLPDYSDGEDFLSDGFKPRKRRYDPIVEGREGR